MALRGRLLGVVHFLVHGNKRLRVLLCVLLCSPGVAAAAAAAAAHRKAAHFMSPSVQMGRYL